MNIKITKWDDLKYIVKEDVSIFVFAKDFHSFKIFAGPSATQIRLLFIRGHRPHSGWPMRNSLRERDNRTNIFMYLK